MDIENQNPNTHYIEESVRWRIIGFLEAGRSQIDAANYFKISKSAVSKLYSKFLKYDDVKDLKRTGRPKKISEENKITMIEEVINQNKVLSCKKISQQMDFIYGRTTIANTLKEMGFEFKKTKAIPYLTSKQISDRKEWTERWKEAKLTNVMFSDECYFHLFRNTLKKWFRDGESQIQQNFVKKLNPNLALMVWGCISWKGKSKLCVLESGFKITKEIYKEILNDYLIPFVDLHKKDYSTNFKKLYFIQDNAPVHSSKYIANWLNENDIDTPKHPANSPDLNAIENIWKILKDSVELFRPQNLRELKIAIHLA